MTPGSRLAGDDRAAVASGVRSALRGDEVTEDDRFRADDGEGRFIRALAREASRMLEDRPAERVLAWAAATVPRFAVTSSFGADSAVLLHMLAEVAPTTPVLFLDTGLHFDGTVTFRRELARDLGLTVLDVRPDRSVAQQAAVEGEALWTRDPDRCCQLRKTVPLRGALRMYDGWATGVRRAQTVERSRTPVVEARHHAGRWLVKVAPLAAWTDDDVDAYLRSRDLPRNPLAERGYESIGCAPCTLPTSNGDDARAGRWAHVPGKSECGLHLDADGALVRATSTPG